MKWGEESDEQGTKFKNVALPKGDPDDSTDQIIGINLTEPETKPVKPGNRNAARDNSSATGNESWDRKLRPKHRRVVREYFGNSGKTDDQ